MKTIQTYREPLMMLRDRLREQEKRQGRRIPPPPPPQKPTK